jgi:hypothetical protein
MNIQFEKASARHIDTIFGWLAAQPISKSFEIILRLIRTIS